VIIEWLGFLASLFTVLTVATGIAVVVDLACWRWNRRTGRKRPTMWRSGGAAGKHPWLHHRVKLCEPTQTPRWLAPLCVFHGGFDPDVLDDE
jgi:hypothetical protein